MRKDISIIPFKAGHVKTIFSLRSDFAIAESFLQFDDYWKAAETGGPAWTAVRDGRVILCAGIARFWPGVGEGWMLGSDEIDGLKLWFHRMLKTGLDAVMEREGLHRLQVTVEETNERARQWIEALGFECEGLMRGYGIDKENYLRYARIN